MIHFPKILQKETTIKLTDKEIAKKIEIGAVTFSRWKKERPKLYQRIKKSFECEALIDKLNTSSEQIREAIAAYKDHINNTTKGKNDDK